MVRPEGVDGDDENILGLQTCDEDPPGKMTVFCKSSV
jgi:hypothetical protein